MSIPTKGAGGSAPGGPLMFYDSFTGSEGDILTDHTPDVGGPWAMDDGIADLTDTNVVNAKTLTHGYVLGYVTPPRLAGQLYVKWRNKNQFTRPRVLLWRYSDVNNHFFVETYCFGNDIKLIKRVSGVETTLDSDLNVSGGIAAETWYYLWVDIVGDAISVYHSATDTKPGSPLLEATDSALNTSRACGFYAASQYDRWDDFTIYDRIIL